jgi:hypothetical protein
MVNGFAAYLFRSRDELLIENALRLRAATRHAAVRPGSQARLDVRDRELDGPLTAVASGT